MRRRSLLGEEEGHSDPDENYSQITVWPGAALPGHGTEKTLQVAEQVTHREDDSTRNTKVTTRAKKRRTECAQMPAPEGKAGDGICHLNAQRGRVSPAAHNQPITYYHK